MLQKFPDASRHAGHAFTPKSYSHWGGYKRFRSLNATELHIIETFYGINVEKLTASTGMRLVVHRTHDDKPKRILLLSEGCHTVLNALLYKAKKETITYAGVRVFSFWSSKLFMSGGESDILFRTTYEGAQHIAPLSDGRRVIPMCFTRYAKLVHKLLCDGTVLSSKLASLFCKVGEKTTASLSECLSVLEEEAFGVQKNSVLHNSCVRASGYGQRADNTEKEISPGPVWIALNLSGLRNTAALNERTADGESNRTLWLSGVLYFSRLEITTKEPIRKGIRLALFQALGL